MKRKLRVLAVVHRELKPPDEKSRYHVNVDWKMEFDVLETLADLGHDLEVLGISGRLSELDEAIDRFRPDVIFNLLEDFQDVAVYDQHWVGYLELLGIPYTGCGPRGLMLARDKALSKVVLSHHGVAVPGFAVVPRGERAVRNGLRFPLIVKSRTYDGSVGISQASVVASDRRLSDRVRFIHRTLGSEAIVEEYIEGRELYVGVIGNETLQTFPVWELYFKNKPRSTRLIATDRVKWSDKYQKKVGVRSRRAKLGEKKSRAIRELARRVYRLLELSGYARIDFRMNEAGDVFVLEANPNPQLSYGEDFAESAEKAGLSYNALMSRILRLAQSRPRP